MTYNPTQPVIVKFLKNITGTYFRPPGSAIPIKDHLQKNLNAVFYFPERNNLLLQFEDNANLVSIIGIELLVTCNRKDSPISSPPGHIFPVLPEDFLQLPKTVSFINGETIKLSPKLIIKNEKGCIDEDTKVLIQMIWSMFLKGLVLFSDKNKINKQMLDNFWEVLETALMVCDEYTFNHSREVAQLSSYLRKETNSADKLDDNYIKSFLYGCMIHDIGKIMWPQFMFRDEDNSEIIKSWRERHPLDGAFLVWPLLSLIFPEKDDKQETIDNKHFRLIIQIILLHHIKKNYPNEEQIVDYLSDIATHYPESYIGEFGRASIHLVSLNKKNSKFYKTILPTITASDIFSAIRGKRAYKPAFPLHLALKELHNDIAPEDQTIVDALKNLFFK